LEPSTRWEDLVLPQDFKERLTLLVQGAGKEGLILYFQGPYGAGKQATAEALCRESGAGLVFVDGGHLGEAAEDVYESLVILADREARLRKAALYWDGFESLLGEDRGVRRRVLLERLVERQGLIFLAGKEAWEPAGGPPLPPFLRVEFPLPDRSQRRRIWERVLGEEASRTCGPGLPALGDKFRLTGGQILDSVATARNRVLWRSPGGGSVSMDDLETACRLHSAPRLSGLARKIEPRVGWADILLPPDQKSQLRDICRQERYRSVVYGEWGFERKLSSGRGLSILFSGPPGTGKTMAAEVIARELKLDLFKIDLAQVVSKYIGETEKNLSRIFQEAEAGHVLLFFDEAEALFGKRSEVKDAHDRYANIELGYLLQRMEEHEGIVILATNLRKNMDEAFIRRMQIVVEFPFPEEGLRRQIWEKIFPAETPLAEDLDLPLLAREVRLAGGNIRNIALRAAFYAAEDGGRVLLSHLREAAQREYQKLGRTWDEKKFPAGEEGALADGEGHPKPPLRSETES
jgi:SpoVK/Ycf46/Vps4 family AAA+-type ATPase